MDQFTDVRVERVAAGWKRGAFISLSDHPEFRGELPNKLVAFLEGKTNPRIVPVLYDCALIEESFEKEPWAQVVICWEVSERSGNYANAKNPRCLHTQALVGDQSIILEISAISFAQVDREALLRCAPDQSVKWVEGKLEQLLDWISERYRQPTFPDAFNNRLRPIQKRLETQWKSELFRDYCAGIYFRLDKTIELADDEIYNLDVIIVVPFEIKGKEYAELDAKHSQNMIDGLKTKISAAAGIKVGKVEMYPEGEFTKEIERNYLRFSLEYFSYASKSGVTLLPAEFNSTGW